MELTSRSSDSGLRTDRVSAFSHRLLFPGGRAADLWAPQPHPYRPSISPLCWWDFLAALLEAPLWGGVTQPGRNSTGETDPSVPAATLTPLYGPPAPVITL